MPAASAVKSMSGRDKSSRSRAVVPVTGAPTDAEALSVIDGAYPDHEVVPVPGAVLAYGGGGPHCITQQVPIKHG